MKILLAALMISVSGLVYAADEYSLSMTDVNRIVCPAPVTDVVFSEEKGLITKVSGKDIFVKFPVVITIDPETESKQTEYYRDKAEVFLVCGGKTYSLILKPSNIKAQTVMLEPLEPELSLEYKGKDEEELIGALMKAAIEDDLAKGFKKSTINQRSLSARGGAELQIIYANQYLGGGYTVREYHIFSPVMITLSAAESIRFEGVKNPLAALVTDETFKGWSRAFVIERSVSK